MLKNMGCEVSIQVHPMPQNEIPEVEPEKLHLVRRWRSAS